MRSNRVAPALVQGQESDGAVLLDVDAGLQGNTFGGTGTSEPHPRGRSMTLEALAALDDGHGEDIIEDGEEEIERIAGKAR